MTMNQDVFLSILSMDSYNRQYGQNIDGLADSGDIGTASIIADSVTALGTASQNSGFYAIAYEWNGNTVISYRGTNPEFSTDSISEFLDSPLVADIWNGWTMGAGFSSATQAGLAIEFYEAVADRSIYSSISNGAPILLTGHSLGGGLAGFVGALSSNVAYGYDHMPFGLAAMAQVLHESIRRAAAEHSLAYTSLPELLLGIENGSIPEIVDNTLTLAEFAQSVVDNLQELAPYFGALTGFNTAGEVLTGVRNGVVQLTIGGIGGGLAGLLGGVPLLGLAIAAAGASLGYTTAELEEEVEQNSFSVFGADLDPIQRHSISLLTTLLFGEKQWESEGGGEDWQESIKYILPATMDDQLASNAFNLETSDDAAAPAGAQMSTMIAYSAIDDGERPFGDTGIRSLFNDADDLGKALKVDAELLPESFDENARMKTGKLIAEFAALLSTGKILKTDDQNAVDGVLSFHQNGSVLSNLLIDLRDDTWTVRENVHEIETKKELIESFVNTTVTTAELNVIKYWYSISASAGGTNDLIDDIDEIIVTLNPATIYAPLDEAGVALQVGSNQSDNFQFSEGSDFVIGGKGGDTLWGNGGADILLGGEGNDVLNGGAGNDWLDGGIGDRDTASYASNAAGETINVSFDWSLANPTVLDGLGGIDYLNNIEIVIGTEGDDNFSFVGSIPDWYKLTIDGGGGDHDSIDLSQLSDPNGVKFYLLEDGSGDGYIQNRSGGIGAGVVYFKNFHTDIVGSDYSDIISDESSGVHNIDAGDGDDKITVAGSGATIDGGAGNDVILLKSSSATIKFGAGGGHDVVNFDEADGEYDLALQGLNPNDVEIIAGGRDVYSYVYEGEDSSGFHVQFIAVRIKSTGETITFLENGKNIGPNGNGSAISYGVDSRKLDSISFADGTVVTREADRHFLGWDWLTWDFWGYKHEYPETSMEHYHTPDSYVDYVNATYLQADPIGAPPPPPDQNHPGTSGDDDLKPGHGNDTVEGSAGNDRVRESRGNDTYKWNVGDGDDIIWGAGALDGFNTLELGAGILSTDLQFAVSDYGAGLTITFAGQTGSVTLSSALVGDGFGVDQIRFADNTIMSRADLITAANSVISAAATTENGTSSSDFIYAPAGNFVIDAGEDDDFITVEGAGAGTFLFSSADGHDRISDYGFGYSRNDTLVLTDANAADITLSRSGDSLLLTINSTGATVDITSQFTEDDGEIHGINTLKFADNTTWTRLQIRDAALGTESGTAPIAEAATAAVVEDGAIIRGTLVASDADDGDVLTFSLDNQIAGLALAANGNWSFDATNAAYQHLSQGEELILTVNYHVTDSAGLTSASTLTLTLTGTSTMPLVEQELINQRLADSAAFTYDVTGSFSDPEGDPLVFTAQLADGSELPTWLTFEDGQFEGTAPTGTTGVLNVVVTASNGALETSSAFRLRIGPGNEAPGVLTPLPNVTGGVDDPLDILVDSFVDADGDPVTLLSVTLADDSPLPSWLSFEDGHLTGTPPVAAFGNTFDIKITATDGYDEGYAQFSIMIGPRIVTGTSGDDAFELSTLFEMTGGLGSDQYIVSGDGGGIFYYSQGDGWDGIGQPDSGVRTDELIFTDIRSDEISVYKDNDALNLFIDESNGFQVSWQFYGDSPGGVNQGLEHIQFSDSVTWDRDEIRNRANAPEIILDISDPSETGSSVSEAFVMESGLGAGTIDDFEVAGANHDYLQFDRSQFDSWAHLLGATTQQGSDLLIDLGGGDSVTLTNVSISAFTSLNVRFFGSASA